MQAVKADNVKIYHFFNLEPLCQYFLKKSAYLIKPQPMIGEMIRNKIKFLMMCFSSGIRLAICIVTPYFCLQTLAHKRGYYKKSLKHFYPEC